MSKKAITSLWMKKFMMNGSEYEHQAFLAYGLYPIWFIFNGLVIDKQVLSLENRLHTLALVVPVGIYKDLSLLNNGIVDSINI